MPTIANYDQFAGRHWETGSVRNFFAQRGWAGGLSVRPGEHGQVGVLFSEVVEFVAQITHLRDQNVGTCGSQHQRIGQVVYVFGRTAEVQKVLKCLCFRTVSELFADEVLNRFDVVVGRRLDSLNVLRIVNRKIIKNVIEDVLHY